MPAEHGREAQTGRRPGRWKIKTTYGSYSVMEQNGASGCNQDNYVASRDKTTIRSHWASTDEGEPVFAEHDISPGSGNLFTTGLIPSYQGGYADRRRVCWGHLGGLSVLEVQVLVY